MLDKLIAVTSADKAPEAKLVTLANATGIAVNGTGNVTITEVVNNDP